MLVLLGAVLEHISGPSFDDLVAFGCPLSPYCLITCISTPKLIQHCSFISTRIGLKGYKISIRKGYDLVKGESLHGYKKNNYSST